MVSAWDVPLEPIEHGIQMGFPVETVVRSGSRCNEMNRHKSDVQGLGARERAKDLRFQLGKWGYPNSWMVYKGK